MKITITIELEENNNNNLTEIHQAIEQVRRKDILKSKKREIKKAIYNEVRDKVIVNLNKEFGPLGLVSRSTTSGIWIETKQDRYYSLVVGFPNFIGDIEVDDNLNIIGGMKTQIRSSSSFYSDRDIEIENLIGTDLMEVNKAVREYILRTESILRKLK